MPPVTPTELIVIVLFAAALLLVPSALAFALFSLSRTDRPEPPPPPAAAPRRSPRRVASELGAAGRFNRRPPPHRPGPRRFGDR